MKQLKLTAATTVLTLALSFSAFAGEIHTDFVDVPPQTSTTTSTTATSQSAAVDPVIQLMLVLLNLLP